MSNFQMTLRDTFRDPSYVAARRRFWRTSLVTQDCAQCGEEFSYEPASRSRRKYCSDTCRRRAAYDAEMEARREAARLQETGWVA